MNPKELKQFINDGFSKLNINLRQKQIENFYNYLKFLIAENKKYNLTSIIDPKKIITLHFFDSAGLFLNNDIKGKVIDIGTGAGFPGFVLKIVRPNIAITLVESNLKKVNFLKMLQIELDLYDNIKVIHKRAESLGHDKDYRERYDFVCSRAVAPLNVLLEYTAPLCKKAGLILLYKGPAYKKELNGAQKAINLLNLRLKNIYKIDIPFLEKEREILTFERQGLLADRYPRRPGIPKKRPL